MGMYCCCDEKISSDYFRCRCKWDGWTSVHDYPPERKNKSVPFGLPEKDGIYMVRLQNNSGDRYETERRFYCIPFLEEYYLFGKQQSYWHWEGESWEDESVYAWKPIPQIELDWKGKNHQVSLHSS